MELSELMKKLLQEIHDNNFNCILYLQEPEGKKAEFHLCNGVTPMGLQQTSHEILKRAEAIVHLSNRN